MPSRSRGIPCCVGRHTARESWWVRSSEPVCAAAVVTRVQKARLAKLSPEQVTATELADEPITAKLTAAPGNGAPLGGLTVTTENAWFAARSSGTEDVDKIHGESFKSPEHLAEVQQAAKDVVNTVIG